MCQVLTKTNSKQNQVTPTVKFETCGNAWNSGLWWKSRIFF